MNNDTERHHEQIRSVQNTFLSRVKSVTDVVEELATPFRIQAQISIHLIPK